MRGSDYVRLAGIAGLEPTNARVKVAIPIDFLNLLNIKQCYASRLFPMILE